MSGSVTPRSGAGGVRRAGRVVEGTPVDLPATPRPGVAKVRVDGPTAVVDATLADLAAAFGDRWQPGTRKQSRHSPGDELVYGTLIVPVPSK